MGTEKGGRGGGRGVWRLLGAHYLGYSVMENLLNPQVRLSLPEAKSIINDPKKSQKKKKNT